ncbi:HAMP domain-containing protein [Pseudomonas sp. 2FG]|uniref:HAMP domain-containing protein n=1 Tax=Pseudomonas sp. 2FG TaxID=2502191 RepID=UPI00273E5BFA|nr:HAMP domain-containing protein [Pseudomonas sp. 2FG]
MLDESEALQHGIITGQQRWNQRAYYAVLGMTLVAVLLSAGAAVLIRRQIVAPLRYTASAVSRVTLGQLDLDVQHSRKDELGGAWRAAPSRPRRRHALVRADGRGEFWHAESG